MNVIVLLTDDHRADILGCAGHPVVQTPNIDQMASEGIRFANNFVTTSICMTSRASIFTGLYARCHQINDFVTMLPRPLFEQSYPMRLRAAGYRTGFIGKWGVGNELPENDFDYFKGFKGQGQYFHEIDGNQVHLDRIIENQSIEFLDGCSAGQPFCLSVSFKAPHVQDSHPDQFLYNPMYDDLYSDVTVPPAPKSTEGHFNRLPDFIRNSEARARWKRRFSTPELYQKMTKGYFRLITGVDRTVGTIRNTLKEKGLDQDTLIIFTGDNGFYLGEFGLAGKWYMHEESIRTPLIIYDPRLDERKRGEVRHGMTLNIDIAPTVMAAAGIKPNPKVEGKNLLPLLDGEMIPWRKEFFYEHLFNHPDIPKTEGIRNEQWKYFRYIDFNPVVEELYDLKTDPGEEHNLSNNPVWKPKLDEMRNRCDIWRNALIASKEQPTAWSDPD